MKTDLSLLFVYNASSGIFSGVKDILHKSVSPKTYRCNLCGLTYFGTSMKYEWKNFVNSLPIKAEFLHKDEFLKKFPSLQNTTFPIAFVLQHGNLVNKLISTQEINQANNLVELKALVQTKISNFRYE